MASIGVFFGMAVGKVPVWEGLHPNLDPGVCPLYKACLSASKDKISVHEAQIEWSGIGQKYNCTYSYHNR